MQLQLKTTKIFRKQKPWNGFANMLFNKKLYIMKIAGIILLILGIIGVVIFGIQVMNDSESFNFLGLDIAVSKANWTPLIVSGVIAIVGGILTGMGKKA